MQQRELLDETFDAGRASGYDLLVRASAQGFSLALLDPVRAMFIGLAEFPYSIITNEAWPDAFRYLAVAHPWVQGPFRNTILSWRGSSFTLAPREYFVEEHAKLLLQRVACVEDLDEVHVTAITPEILSIFTVPAQLLYAWRTAHPQVRVVHEDAALLKIALTPNRKGKRLIIHLRDEFATLALLQDQTLRAMLPVQARTGTDLLYHITALLSAHQIEPIEVKYRLLGRELSWPSATNPRQREYLGANAVREMLTKHFLPSEHRFYLQGYEYSYLLEKLQQSYLPLFALAQCV